MLQFCRYSLQSDIFESSCTGSSTIFIPDFSIIFFFIGNIFPFIAAEIKTNK